MPAALALFLCLAVAYGLGAVPFGFVLAKWLRGVNLLEAGSGNIGATNVRRLCGMPLAVVVFLLDTAKGVAAVWLARAALPQAPQTWAWGVVACGMAAIVGHNWSVFLRFHGGRGTSTSLGVIIGLHPLTAALAFAVWMVVVAATKYVSVASLAGCTTVAVLFSVFRLPPSYQVLGYLGAALMFYRHRPNLDRLLRGQEPRAWGAKQPAPEEEKK